MLDDIKEGQDWIEETIRQSSSVDVEIRWELDDDFGPPDAPDPSGKRSVKAFYRVAIVTPEGQRGTERIRHGDIEECGEECADDRKAKARHRVRRQVLGLLLRLGIAK